MLTRAEFQERNRKPIAGEEQELFGQWYEKALAPSCCRILVQDVIRHSGYRVGQIPNPINRANEILGYQPVSTDMTLTMVDYWLYFCTKYKGMYTYEAVERGQRGIEGDSYAASCLLCGSYFNLDFAYCFKTQRILRKIAKEFGVNWLPQFDEIYGWDKMEFLLHSLEKLGFTYCGVEPHENGI